MNWRDITSQIVICSDAQIGDEYSVTEDMTKWEFIGTEIVAMYSGTLDEAEDAFSIYKSRLKSLPLTLAEHKEQLYVGYQEFQDALKRRGIRKTDVELIVAGFVQGEPKILSVSRAGVSSRHNYYAIGAGAAVADAMLRWRQLSPRWDSSQVLYLVYEAKRLGEVSPHVGKKTTDMWILERRKEKFEWKRVHEEGLGYLQAQFEQLGPQRYMGEPGDFPWRSLHSPKCSM